MRARRLLASTQIYISELGNPLLNALTTHVIQCQESQSLEPPKDKKKAPQAAQKGKIVQVLLHDTILFPEGGGQPSDIGFMESADGHVWPVLEVKRHGHHAIHYVKDGEIMPSGSVVKVYLGEEGFRRRYDHVSQRSNWRTTLLQTLISKSRCACILASI